MSKQEMISDVEIRELLEKVTALLARTNKTAEYCRNNATIQEAAKLNKLRKINEKAIKDFHLAWEDFARINFSSSDKCRESILALAAKFKLLVAELELRTS